jgi:hypothetical protein
VDETERIREALKGRRAVGFDMAGLRVDGRLHRLFTAFDASLTLASVQEEDGRDEDKGLDTAEPKKPGAKGRAKARAMAEQLAALGASRLCSMRTSRRRPGKAASPARRARETG